MDILLRHDCILHPEDWQKNILLPFEIPKAYDRLAILLQYGPKEVCDRAVISPQIEACVARYFPPGTQLSDKDREKYPCLYNFVTLSLDCGEEYIGCAHRHPPRQTICIAQERASWGFQPHAITKGLWRVVLHVQAVVAGTVDCHVAVCGLEKGEHDDLLPSI